jgi:AraC family transcriptional regulator
MEYVRERRLAESAEALAKTDEKITDIAHKYQYGSEEAFSRAFRKVFGSSPRDYRNTWNENYHDKSTYIRTKKLLSTSNCTRLSMAA